MNKKLLSAFIAAITLLTSFNMAKADQPRPATVAILDTALNTSLPIFKDRIVQEVCILEFPSCANGKNFMEGSGAAFMPLKQMSLNGFNHGTKMTATSVLTNSNIKVVFIRIVGATLNGDRQVTNEITVINALNWVIQNKDKYNITAVAMSQAHHNLMSGANYCPTTVGTQNAVTNLNNLDVPVFFAAGNARDISRVSWPACIPESIAVSASSTTEGIAIYSNYDIKLTDMFALGRLSVPDVNGSYFTEDGTSVSAQVAAAIYVGLKNKYPTYTKQQIFDLMKSKSNPVKTKMTPGYIVTKSILNG